MTLLLKRTLLLTMLVAIAVGLSNAQEAPAKPEAEKPTKLELLTSQEMTMWQAWIRGENEACYQAAKKILGSTDTYGNEFNIALALLRKATAELGWHKQHVTDLEEILAIHGDRRNSPQNAEARWELIEALRRVNRLG